MSNRRRREKTEIPTWQLPPPLTSRLSRHSSDRSCHHSPLALQHHQSLLRLVADLAEQLDQQERSKYVKGKKLGSGQYADVFTAHLVSDPTKLVAIKKIKVVQEVKEFGISYDSLREIKFLQELNHPNIIKLHAVFSTRIRT
ncbi:hypothetical protein MRB53_039692 [Persea americana]|nr:hypothetical protein MRB53_039692 [Persea americana]